MEVEEGEQQLVESKDQARESWKQVKSYAGEKVIGLQWANGRCQVGKVWIIEHGRM